MIKVCAHCGKEFEPVKHAGGRQIYCLPCRAEVIKERRQFYRARAKAERHAKKDAKERARKRKPNSDCFAFEALDECTALGWTYCQLEACNFYKPRGWNDGK